MKRLAVILGFGVALGWRFHEVLWRARYFASDRGDNFQVHFPFFSHLIDSLQQTGSFDAWNPYVWGGMPGIGNPNVPMGIGIQTMLHFGRAGFIVAMNWHLFA